MLVAPGERSCHSPNVLRFALILSLGLFACGDETPSFPGTPDAAGRDGGPTALDGSIGGFDAGPPWEPGMCTRGPDDGSGPRIRLGFGVTRFCHVPDGEDVELIMGPQGGWHVDVAVEIFELEPMDMWLRIRGYDADTGDEVTLPIDRLLSSRRVRRVDDHWLRLGDQAVFSIFSPGEIAGRDVRIEVTAEAADMRTAMVSQTIHVVDEE